MASPQFRWWSGAGTEVAVGIGGKSNGSVKGNGLKCVTRKGGVRWTKAGSVVGCLQVLINGRKEPKDAERLCELGMLCRRGRVGSWGGGKVRRGLLREWAANAADSEWKDRDGSRVGRGDCIKIP